MLLTANVWRSTDTHDADAVHLRHRRVAAAARQREHEGRGEWTMLGGQMHIHPALGVGVTARFPTSSATASR